MGKITKNYIYNLIYQVFVMIVPLITAPYLARVLGANCTGIFGYVHSMTAIVCTIVMLGVYNYGSRQIAYVRDNPKKRSEVFWQIMSLRLIIAIFGTIVFVGLIFIINKYITFFLIYYTYLLVYFVDCTWLYVGVADMKWAVIKNAVTKAISVAGIFTLVKSENDLYLYFLIQGCSVLISNLIAYSQLRLYIRRPHLDFSNVFDDLKGSVLLFLPSVAATIYTQSDKIMIELMTGATNEVSFYDYSEKIVTIPLTFISVLSTVMMPRIANEYKKGNKDVISDLINRAAKFSLFIAFPMCLGLISCADKLIPWYLGQSFLPTITAIILISPIIVANTLTGISGGQYFTATNQMKILIISQFSAVVGNIAINAFLIPFFGFIGAAIATLATSYTCAIIQYFFLSKQVKLPGLIKSGLKYLTISIAMFLVIRLISADMSATPITNIIQIVVGLCFYLGVCLIIKDEHIAMLSSKFIIHNKK